MIKPVNKIPYSTLRHSEQILHALNSVEADLQKISGVKKVLSLVKDRTGIDLFKKEVKIECENKTVSLSTPDRFTLLIKIQNLLNKEKQELIVQNSEVQGTNTQKEDIGTLLSDILEQIDFPLLKLRRFLVQDEISSIIEKLSPKAVMNNKCCELSSEIQNLFHEIYGILTSIPDIYTKLQIRNGYPAISSGRPRSRQLDFLQIGSPKADYSINIVNNKKSETMTVITVQEADKEAQHIIINSKNQVMKQSNVNPIYNFASKTVFYSQKELDSWDFKDKLMTLRDELVKYKEHLNKSIQSKAQVREFYSTSEIGKIDSATLTLIQDVKKLFDAVKAKMLKIKEPSRKAAYKRQYQIDTIMSSPSLIFRNTSQTGESIHLSFPKLNGVVCTKILVVSQNNKITKSLFIENDKLVKFNATSLGRSKRKDTVTNYHSQEEVNNSGIQDILKLLKSRLSVIKT